MDESFGGGLCGPFKDSCEYPGLVKVVETRINAIAGKQFVLAQKFLDGVFIFI
jgi:hypothetical protein